MVDNPTLFSLSSMALLGFYDGFNGGMNVGVVIVRSSSSIIIINVILMAPLSFYSATYSKET